MHGVVQFVQYVNLALYTVVAIAAVWLWWRHREVAGLWAALSFGLLAFIVDVGPLLPDDPQGFWEELAIRALIAGLVVFPFLLFRFAVSFRRYGAPPVTITAQQNDRHFRLTVEDRGEGVSPEFVPDLFERFTRSRGARTRTGGTGLGLAIARSYALAHRGDLIYAPAHPQGARFQLVLPVQRR